MQRPQNFAGVVGTPAKTELFGMMLIEGKPGFQLPGKIPITRAIKPKRDIKRSLTPRCNLAACCQGWFDPGKRSLDKLHEIFKK